MQPETALILVKAVSFSLVVFGVVLLVLPYFGQEVTQEDSILAKISATIGGLGFGYILLVGDKVNWPDCLAIVGVGISLVYIFGTLPKRLESYRIFAVLLLAMSCAALISGRIHL